jgi:hypothetical protein
MSPASRNAGALPDEFPTIQAVGYLLRVDLKPSKIFKNPFFLHSASATHPPCRSKRLILTALSKYLPVQTLLQESAIISTLKAEETTLATPLWR